MNDKQKALFKQLQLAGLGIILMLFGIFFHHFEVLIIGSFVLAFGLLRVYLISKLIHKIEKDEEA